MTQQQEQAALSALSRSSEVFLKTEDTRVLETLRQREFAIALYVEHIIKKYFPFLHAYAFRLLHGDNDAVDDVLQQSWIALYHNGTRYGPEWLCSDSVAGWLKTVVFHTAYDYRKKQRRMLSLDADEAIWVLAEQTSDPFERADVLFARGELAYEFLDILQQTLTSVQLLTVLSVYLYNYSIRSIAYLLDCPENTVKSYLRRSRARLREAFEDAGIRYQDIKVLGGLRETFDQVLLQFDPRKFLTGESEARYHRLIAYHLIAYCDATGQEATLRQEDPRGKGLNKIVLTRKDLNKAVLYKANLIGADLRKTDLSQADLIGADLSQADLSEADLSDADLHWAKLHKANLREAHLRWAFFYGADLSQADLSYADLSKAFFKKANLQRANFKEADLSDADLGKADLREADLTRANLSNTYFGYADLRGAKLTENHLEGVNFMYAHLEGADFMHAHLGGADFSSAHLEGAKLSEADLVGADLGLAKLSEANLVGADLRKAWLFGASLVGADLSDADLSDADLREADLREADLSRTRVSSRQLKHVKSLRNTILPDGSKHP